VAGDDDDPAAGASGLGLFVSAGLSMVPWTVQVLPGELFFVFPWGLASTRSLDVVLLDTYLLERTAGVAGLPRRLLAWPISTVVYACALALTALGSLAVPVGPLLSCLAAWWVAGWSRPTG